MGRESVGIQRLTVAAHYALYVYRRDRAFGVRYGLTVDGIQ